jgi:hypothetical protein
LPRRRRHLLDRLLPWLLLHRNRRRRLLLLLLLPWRRGRGHHR